MIKKSKSLTCDVIRKIRKANYWQRKKDEWKKHGAVYKHFRLSELITDDLLQGYMDNGWQEITTIYKQGLNDNCDDKEHKSEIMNNFSSCASDQQELVLEILGSIRKYMVKSIFHSLRDDLNTGHLNEIISVGSSNVTSDYDVSILGPDANEIMWKMFVTFLAKFEDDLPSALDVNLYACPLYAHQNNFNVKIPCKNIDKLPQRVNYGNQQFTLVPYNQDDLDIELSWACVKIIDLFLPLNNQLQKYIDNANKYKLAMDKLFNNIQKDETYLDISLQNNLHPANTITKNTREIIKRYYLQYLWQKPIQKYIYSMDNKNIDFIDTEIYLLGDNKPQTNLFFYTGIPNYFASESYYTSSAVNAIVIENQINRPLDLSGRDSKIRKWMYFISAIENTGDYLKNIKEDLDKLMEKTEFIQQSHFQIIIIKYSKYLYRIYDMLGKIGYDSDKFNTKAYNLQKYVLPFRKNYNLNSSSSINMLSYLHYNYEYPLHYISKVGNILTKDLNDLFIKIK